MTETLNRVLQELDHLEPRELEQLNAEVQARLGAEEAKRKRFHEALLASGLVRQIRSRHGAGRQARRLVEVQGKPVSETIIEERR